jgi:hypothetical protein
MFSKKRIRLGGLVFACLLSSCSSRIDKLNREIMMTYPYSAMADNTSNCSTVPYMIRVNGIWTPVKVQK